MASQDVTPNKNVDVRRTRIRCCIVPALFLCDFTFLSVVIYWSIMRQARWLNLADILRPKHLVAGTENPVGKGFPHPHGVNAPPSQPTVFSLGIEAAGHEYNESSLPFRQLTNFTTSVETIWVRPKHKDDTNVVTTQKSTYPYASAKGPRKKKIEKSASGLVPKPLPTIFNVGQSSLLPGLVNRPSSTTASTSHSAFCLDDIPFQDMNTLPSIPSPPVSPKNNTATNASPHTSFSYSASDAPFSMPYDEDALLENEFRFPLNKHCNVIIENMGVKKAKNKGKEILLNRYITTARSDLPPHSGLALPLPLRPLCQNTIALNPLPFRDTFSKPTMSGISAGPSSSRKDAWGSIHLGAADCDLSIAFPETSHYEVWDMDDESVFSCPAFLCLMTKNSRIWTGTPISRPDVSLIDIRCDDLPVPSSMSVYDPTIEYATQCVVTQKAAWDKSLSSSHRQGTSLTVDHEEITINGKWERAYARPKMEGQTQILRIADSRSGSDAHERGWYLKFWIPIPARLFMKRETRIFEIRASVWMMADEERVSGAMALEGEEEEGDFALVAEAEMTVSHLRREREMTVMTMN